MLAATVWFKVTDQFAVRLLFYLHILLMLDFEVLNMMSLCLFSGSSPGKDLMDPDHLY